MKKITGNAFIIPISNGIIGEKNCWTVSSFEKEIEFLNKKINTNLTTKDILVPIWAYSPTNPDSNWSCHGIDDLDPEERYGDIKFPANLPITLFEGKKEGDVVKFNLCNKYEIELTLTQKESRYRTFPFEEQLKILIDRYESSKERK